MLWLALGGLLATSILVLGLAAARRQRRRLESRRKRHAALATAAAEAGLEVGPAEGELLLVRHPASGRELRLAWERPDLPPHLASAFADPPTYLEGARVQLEAGARAHAEPLTLNREARHLAPLMLRSEWLATFPEGVPPHTRLGTTDLTVIYRFIDRDGLPYLNADCLAATGIEVADLHGALAAMLSQRLDEELVAAAIASEKPTLFEDAEGISTSFLFLLPELLTERPGERLIALAPAAGRLVLTHPAGLEEVLARERARRPEGRDWLESEPILVDAEGVRALAGSA